MKQEEEPMAERFSDIETSALGPQSLEARLKTYPELRAKIETMLSIIENASGDVEKAAVAEQRVIDAMRELGNDVLHQWARQQHQKKEIEFQTKPGVNRKEKKLHARPTRTGASAVFGVSGGRLSGILGRAATGHHGFWGGRSVYGRVGQAARALWD